MKVYVVVYDYRGYDEIIDAVFETFKEAKKYLKKECGDYAECCIVEWDTKTQERKKVKQGQSDWPNI